MQRGARPLKDICYELAAWALIMYFNTTALCGPTAFCAYMKEDSAYAEIHLPSMPPYLPRASPYRRILTTVRLPWIWFPLLLGCSVVLHLQVVRLVHPPHHEECRHEPIRSTLDNYQHL